MAIFTEVIRILKQKSSEIKNHIKCSEEEQMKYLIIGNGIAGVSAAETIRSIDQDSDITMVSKEKTPPYSRPLISYVVSGELKDAEIIIRDADFYEKLGINTQLGKRVLKVDADQKKVFLESGESIEWDRLLVASGADPRLPGVEGTDLENIFTLRNIKDAKKIVSCCKHHVKKAIVLGGGLVGFKAAYGLLKRGVEVSIFITSPYPLSQVADEQSGILIMEALRDHGLKVEVGRTVEAFEGRDGKVSGVVLKDGDAVKCDMVVVGKGVDPAVDFLGETGIRLNRGVVVNTRLESSIPGIYAAGDVAEAPDIVWRENRINAIWPVAVEQGRIAAMNMAGLVTSYVGSLARNVIRIFDLDFMSGGIVNPPDEKDYEIRTSYDERKKKYKKLVFREECLVGMVLVNCIDQGGVLLNLVSQGRKLRNLKKTLLRTEDYYPVLETSWRV